MIPFWSFLVWFFYPKTELPGLILDKTVLEKSGVEHRSFNWITTNRKFTKEDGSQYEISEDYYGFFPVNRPEYVVKDLTVFNRKELDSLANYLEFVYYTDAYGIYTNEWVYGRDINERSRLVYGGLSENSYLLFERMFRNRKLTISEFNNIASPTPLNIRFRMQRLLESDFTGWTGRYYHSLDTLLNPDIPGWMKRLHRRYYGRPFAYPDIPGIVLVHEAERIAVLQIDKDLDYEIPIINTGPELIEMYDLPEYIRYPYWFDINFAKDTANTYATYKIHTTDRGDSILSSHNLPNEFPAILADHKEKLRWYFCGDWADSPTPFGLSYFKGVQFLRKFFYNNRDELDRKKFFWEYYEPLVSGIFNDYIEIMDSVSGPRPLPPVHRNYVPYYRKHNVPLPDIDLIASGRVYDPEEVLGSEYKERAYRDSVLQAERDEAARTGYYIGQYGDTVYLTDAEIAELEAQARYEEYVQQRRDSVNRRRLDSIRGVGEFDPDRRELKIDSAYLRGGRIPVKIPLTKADYERRAAQKRAAEKRKERDAVMVLREIQAEERRSEIEKTEREALSDGPLVDARYQVGGRRPVGFQAPAQKSETLEDKDSIPEVEEDYSKPEEPEAQAAVEEDVISTENQAPRWHIIIASFNEKAVAEAFVRRRGDKQMEILPFPDLDSYRLSYRSFDTAEQATEALQSAQALYPDAWILKR